MGSIQQSDVRAPLIDHPERGGIAVRADTLPARECLCTLHGHDGFCRQAATWWAGSGFLPVCDECREYMADNEWPYGFRRIEAEEVAS